MKAVKARKDARRRRVASTASAKWLAGTPNLDAGLGPRALRRRRTRSRSTARRSRRRRSSSTSAAAPVLPTWPGIADVPVLTNTSMMDVDTLPEHLVIVGGSYIGLEFAQMYRRFGARVTVLEYGDRLIAREDPEVSREVQAILEREGIAFHFSVQQRRGRAAAQAASGVRVGARRRPARRVAIEGSHLLAAVGRAAQHRRPRPRQGRHRRRRARLHHRRRRAAHQRPRRLGARRRQRPRRVHAHLVQRLRDRRRQPARRRQAPRQRPHPDLRALHRSAARPRRHERGRGARSRQAGAGRHDADDARRPGHASAARRRAS